MSTPPNDTHFDKNETFQILKKNPSSTLKITSKKNTDFTALRKQPARTKLWDIIRTNDLVFQEMNGNERRGRDGVCVWGLYRHNWETHN